MTKTIPGIVVDSVMAQSAKNNKVRDIMILVISIFMMHKKPSFIFSRFTNFTTRFFTSFLLVCRRACFVAAHILSCLSDHAKSLASFRAKFPKRSLRKTTEKYNSAALTNNAYFFRKTAPKIAMEALWTTILFAIGFSDRKLLAADNTRPFLVAPARSTTTRSAARFTFTRNLTLCQQFITYDTVHNGPLWFSHKDNI